MSNDIIIIIKFVSLLFIFITSIYVKTCILRIFFRGVPCFVEMLPALLYAYVFIFTCNITPKNPHFMAIPPHIYFL